MNERGISVVELLVGVVLLTVVVVSLAASGMYASRTLTRSRNELEAAEFQQGELERLLAAPYFTLESGSRETETGSSTWTVVEQPNHLRILLITDYSPNEAISVQDSVVAFRLRP